MHPIELLRHVARAQGADATVLVREAAVALAGLDGDAPGLVTACRRPVDGHPTILVDGSGDAAGLSRRLRHAGVTADDVPDAGLGAAVAAADLVVLEAVAVGPDGLVAVSGSYAAAAVGRAAEVPVWVVAGAGRVLPGPLWASLTSRHARAAGPGPGRVVPLALCDVMVGPDGRAPAAEAAARPGCPVAPELLRPVG